MVSTKEFERLESLFRLPGDVTLLLGREVAPSPSQKSEFPLEVVRNTIAIISSLSLTPLYNVSSAARDLQTNGRI